MLACSFYRGLKFLDPGSKGYRIHHWVVKIPAMASLGAASAVPRIVLETRKDRFPCQ